MEQKKTINKKWITAIVIVCIAVAVSVIALGGNSGEKPAEQMEMADRYMDEKNYEAANPASYKEASEVYIAMGEYDDAIKVLEDGYAATGSEEIRSRREELEALLQAETDAGEEVEENEEDVNEEELTAEVASLGIDLMYRDGAAALTIFEKLAVLGNGDSIFLAGYMLDCGSDYSGQRDFEKAREYYEMVEDQNPYALITLGYLYLNGQGVEADADKADEYFRKALVLIDENEVANLAYANVAYYLIGWLYYDGNGVEQDYALAKEWYEKAAALGNADAINQIGLFYYYGNGVNQDYELAKEWWEKAAELGNATSMNNIGNLYRNGDGVEQDYELAMEWYEKAAELGHSNAMNNIGNLYQNGDGVKRDYELAKEWWEKAAELGNAYAMETLGYIYFYGDGVEQDDQLARGWWEKAVALGNENAQWCLDNY